MFEIKNLSFSYDDNHHVLNNINISLENNQIVAILGESGVGKSTLFNLISGSLEMQSGSILMDGKPIDVHQHVSYMLQKDLLFSHKTIQDNVALPLLINKMPKSEARKKAYDLLKEFHLENYAKKYPFELSGGMRQRVALLRTYMFNRKFLLLDEAFSAIDTITRNEMYNWYMKTSEKLGLTTLLITHDIDEAIFLSNKIYVLKGKPANVVLELNISFDNPRSKDILLTNEFIEYKKKILNALEN